MNDNNSERDFQSWDEAASDSKRGSDFLRPDEKGVEFTLTPRPPVRRRNARFNKDEYHVEVNVDGRTMTLSLPARGMATLAALVKSSDAARLGQARIGMYRTGIGFDTAYRAVLIDPKVA